MPYKNQTKCYRTIKGEKWENFCDVLSEADAQSVAELKKAGRQVRMVKHPDGFLQAFVRPEAVS